MPHPMKDIWPLLLLLVCGFTTADSVEEDWELVRDRDGIRVYTRNVAGSDYKAFRGEVVVQAGLNTLMAVMDDLVGNCPRLMYNCRAAKLLEKNSLLDRHYYMVNRFPWPASDRNMIVHSLIHQDSETRSATVSLSAVAASELSDSAREALPDSGRQVRVSQLEGFFRFVPEAEGHSRVIYQLHLDPDGALPAGIVNSMIVDTPFETLKSLRELVKAPEYQCFQPF